MDSQPQCALGLESIFHPTDFTLASTIAFAHALKFAAAAKAAIEIIHVASDAPAMERHDYPSVRQTLARWGVLPERPSQADVAEFGLSVHKSMTYGPHAADVLLNVLEKKPADLIVLANHRRGGISRWLHEEVANKVARRSGTMTLLIPEDVKGFVSLEDGGVSLRRILIPVDDRPNPQAAIEAAAALAELLECEPIDFNLFHVGSKNAAIPWVHLPQRSGWIWGRTHRTGDVVNEILTAADEYAADLIVVTTQGHDSLLDVLRGSTTERVLRAAHCPVLAIPAVANDQWA